jgi:hypothetical protein
MATYQFPNSFSNQITDPVVTVHACTDNWNGACSVQILLVTPSSSKVFMFPNMFNYVGGSYTHTLVEDWVASELEIYEV